jgi:hypothetical protein
MTHYPSRNETILSSVQTSKSCISETSLWPHNGVPSLDKLIFAGKAGTGFDLKTGHDLVVRLRELVRSDPPFAAVPRAYQRGPVGPSRGWWRRRPSPHGRRITYCAIRVSKGCVRTSRRRMSSWSRERPQEIEARHRRFEIRRKPWRTADPPDITT